MAAEVAESPSALQYLDKALGGLREVGLAPKRAKKAPEPIVALLEQISHLAPDKIAAIARTLDEMGRFNDVVREQVGGVTISDRYEGITSAFTSIRDDARGLVQQYADGKISTMERISTTWMKMVQEETANQIEREQTILEA
ncbi:MAG: cell surface protein, partial [Pseudomonadota bacterium]